MIFFDQFRRRARLTDQHRMYRSFIASCLLGAVLAWPSTAAAQGTASNCNLESFDKIDLVQDSSGRVVRREARGSLERPVEARCGEVLLIAREIDHLLAENRLLVRGNVVFQQAGTRIVAARGEFDLEARTGFFESASGTLQLTDRQIDKTLFGSQEPEAVFTADRIEKIGPKTYRLTRAVFSACVQPTRRWEVTSSQLTFTVDKHAIMRNAVLRVKEVPMLYMPVFYYPIHEDGRATGFLMPSYGRSTFHGFSLSNAFFWAIGRSHDATLYHDWFTSSGQGFGADYRFVGGPNSRGDARFYMIREKAQFADDGTLLTGARRSYDMRGHITQNLPGGLKFQAQADYFTDVATQQLYQVDLSSFAQRSRGYRLDLGGSWGRLRAWAQADRNDVFYGTESAASVRYEPRTNISISEAPLFGTPFRFGATFDAMKAVRFEDLNKPETRIGIFRTDGKVTLSVPLRLGSALSLNARASMQRTDWDLSRDPVTGQFVKVPITRRIAETSVSIRGPNFVRVFNTPRSGFAERFKHVIEPYVTVQRTTAFDHFNQVVQFDSVDTMLGGLTRVTYGVTNSLLARIRQAEGAPAIREVLSVAVSQTYYTNKLAASYDQQYQSSFANLYSYTPPPSNYSPVRASVEFKPSNSLGSQFGLEYDTQFRAVRSYNASFNTSHPMFEVNSTWSKRQFIPGLRGYDNPLTADHFVTAGARVRKPAGGASIGYAATYDVLRERFLQQRFSGFYNGQCCGVSVDYAVTNLKHVGLRNDKRISISLTLAGIGSFTNPLGVFGNNGQR